jgi:hypothetical protein
MTAKEQAVWFSENPNKCPMGKGGCYGCILFTDENCENLSDEEVEQIIKDNLKED